VAGANVHSGGSSGPLPDAAVLQRLSWDGPPKYPYIHGHFRRPGQRSAGPGDELDVLLHTATLNELCRRLHVHQQWGF
jgi:hypothetical protein